MVETRISQFDFFQAIMLMMLSAASLALAAAFGKYLTALSILSVIIFIRFATPFLLLSVLAITKPKYLTIPLDLRSIFPHILRAIFTVISQYCFFILLAHKSLLVATILFSTSGLFSPFIARSFFKTQIKVKTLVAITISFIGIVISLGVTSGFFSTYTIIGLLAGFFNAASQITSHYCSKRINPISNNFLMYGFSTLLALIMLVITGATDNVLIMFNNLHLHDYFMIILFSIFSLSNQFFRISAYRLVNKAASLAPYLYTSIIFSGILDWLLHHIHPTWNNYFGAFIIILGVTMMSYRKTGK